MVGIKVNVIADVSQLLKIDRFSKNNQPILLNTAAIRYLQFQRKRYLALSAGGGEWPKLKKVTIQRKKRRGIAENPRAILREYDTLISSLGFKTIGRKIFVGFTRNRPHPRGKSVFQIAKIHTKGLGRVPVRRVVGLPDKALRIKMVDDIRTTYNKIIRANRRR